MQGVNAPVVELTVPCLPEYVSVVRLAVLGLCGRAALSYDDVEDLRLAVGEACASSVTRAQLSGTDSARIKVSAAVDDERIVLEIQDDVPLAPEMESEEGGSLETDFDDQHFRVSLMQLLVDEIDVKEAGNGGQVVRLVKFCEPLDEDEP